MKIDKNKFRKVKVSSELKYFMDDYDSFQGTLGEFLSLDGSSIAKLEVLSIIGTPAQNIMFAHQCAYSVLDEYELVVRDDDRLRMSLDILADCVRKLPLERTSSPDPKLVAQSLGLAALAIITDTDDSKSHAAIIKNSSKQAVLLAGAVARSYLGDDYRGSLHRDAFHFLTGQCGVKPAQAAEASILACLPATPDKIYKEFGDTTPQLVTALIYKSLLAEHFFREGGDHMELLLMYAAACYE